MNRIDRLSAILIHLQSKKVVKAQEIADRFEISLRTVYRDIRALEEAGVPIGAEPGLGYFLMEGYSLPPVRFSKEQAGALLMASKLAEQQTDKSIKANLSDALFKIRAALKLEEKDYLESIENNIEVLHSIAKPINSDFPDHFLTDIQMALSQNNVLNFDYYSNYNDRFTNRDVEPLSLCYYARHWHLIGYCKLRNDLRDFRSDRIMKLHIKKDQFDPTHHKSYKGYVETIIQGSNLKEVTVLFHKQAARFVKEQRYFMGYISSEFYGDQEEMQFIAPTSLKTRVIELFEKGLNAYTTQKKNNISYFLLT